jgi:ribonuclease P protein component
MLPRSQRNSKGVFNEIIQKGSFLNCNFFIIRTVKTQTESHFSVSVPKKVSKLAVERNKIRRRVYSAIQKFGKRIATGYNAILIMKQGSEKLEFDELTKEIDKNFVKYGLLK